MNRIEEHLLQPQVTVADRLRQARERIKHPANWTVGALARNIQNTPVSSESPTAVRWCAIGALGGSGDEPSLERHFLKRAVQQLIGREQTVESFNDFSYHLDVMKMYDIAIRLAEEADGITREAA